MEPLFSALADDPEIAELLGSFHEELDRRALELRRALGAGDRTALALVAHQLAGTGGSYGFDEITDEARRLERAMAEAPDEIAGHAEALLVLCQRVAEGCRILRGSAADGPRARAPAPLSSSR